MVATTSVRFDFGGVDDASGTQQDIDSLGPPSLKYKLADNATIDTSNPIIIPVAGAGPYYSYWKHVYLYCDNADGKTLSNIKFYSDGSNGFGTGVDLLVGSETPTRHTTAPASQAGYQVTTNTGVTMIGNHPHITAVASVFTFTSTAPKTVSCSEDGSHINANGETSDYVVLQMSVANTAAGGVTGRETTYFSYDEA